MIKSFKCSVFSVQWIAVWLLAAILSPLAPSALAPSASAATITGPIIKADSTAYVGTILFRPLSTPLPIAPNIVTGGDFKVSTASDGTFSVALQAGDYRVIIGADKGFLIDVPNDSATYTLISRITTALTWNSSIVPSTNLYATATSSTEGILKTYSTVGSPVVFTTNDLPTMGSYLTRHLLTAAYTTIATLQAATVPSVNKQRIFVGGVTTDGDGGGGWFTYDSTNSITSDGYMIVAPNSGPGRYLREYNGPLNVLWFGATGDGVTDDAAAVQRAINWADAPTYGYGLNAYGSSISLGVYCPPGRYLTRSTITLKGADLFGTWGGKGDWNSHTVFVCGHSGHLFTYDYNTNNRVPHIHDLYMFGYPETYQANKVAISAVTSRTVFTVATNSLPTLSGSGIPNFAFFYDNEGAYLGHGIISSINSTTGDVTLATGYDNYATVTAGAGLLRTADKVVFTPLIASEGFYTNISDPASAGSCAIFIKNTHASAGGRPPRMSRLYIERFFCGIRIGGNILDSWADDVTVMGSKFAAICAPRWYATTDNIYSRLYLASLYRADYDTTRTNTYVASELRNSAFGYYGLGPSDHLSTSIIESSSLANICLVGTLQQSIHDVHLDDTKRYGLMAIEGYNSGAGPFSTWVQVSQCFIRSPLAGQSQDSIHTNDRVAVKITGTTVGKPVRLGFSQISIVDGGGGDFNSGFDIATAPAHTVRVSQLQDTSGTTDVVASGSGKVQFLDWRAIGSAALADVGPYWPAANSWSVAASGGQVLNIQNTGAKIWANSGADPLELVRNDTGHSWGVQLSTDTLRLRNTFRGVTGLDLYADTSQIIATLGLGGYSSAPRNVQLQAELASSAAGTDVAASTFNVIGSRGTGASTTGGDINFYTAVAGSSGTTAQSVANRLTIKRDGQVRFVGKSSAPTVNVTDGDLYYDSSVPGLRIRQSGAWVTLGAAGSGGVVDGDKGDITATASGTTWTIDPGAVTYAKMQDVSAASKLLGRGSASGSGDVEEITLGTGLQLTGTVLQATIGNEIQAWDSDLAALAALATGADKVPYFTGASMAALADFTSFGRTLVGSANAAAARSSMGVAVGSDVQAYDAELAALAGVTSAADKLPYFTGSGTADVTDLTAFARTVLAAPDQATTRTLLGMSATNGTVTSVSVTTTNGISGTVATATSTPQIQLTLGAITPSSVNGYTITPGSGTLGFGSGGTVAYQGGTLAQFAATTSAQLAGVLSDETGSGGGFVRATSPTIDAPTITGHPTIEGVTSTGATGTGALVYSTAPTFVTPALGVATATSINGTTIPSSKTLVVTTDKLSVHAATTSSELAGVISDETGSGALVFGTSPTLTTPVLGVATATSINSTTIPSSKTLVVTTDKLSVHAATTSSELAGVISDETGTGALVLGTNPTLTTQTIIGTASTDGPTLGSEFLGASGWTSTDWTGSWAGGWTHTTGNTTALTQSTAAVSATKYQITYTVTGRTAGTFDISFGGVSTTGLSATGAWGPTTTSTASLSITPTSTFDGTIVLSIKAMTSASTAVLSVKSSGGTAVDELRASSSTGSTFHGFNAGRYITTGSYNSAFGYGALRYTTTGFNNSAFGVETLGSNTTGTHNTSAGYASLNVSTVASANTAVGSLSMLNLVTGDSNCSFGYSSGRHIADGVTPNTSSSFSVFIGNNTKPLADGDSNEIVIGNSAIGAGSNTATLGNTSITKTVLRGAVNIGTGPAILTGPAANTLQIGDSDSASPSAQTVKFQSVIAGTSNTAGPNATLKAPASTGNANGGSLKLQVTAPGSSGTSQNTWVDAFSVAGDANLTATFSGVVRLKSYTVATLPAAGTAGRIAYVTDATAPTYRGALTGGGAVTCLVFDNGTSWESH